MVKKTIILLLLSFIAFEAIGQSDEELVMVVEEAPIFKGDLELFIKDNIRYPSSAIKDSVEGTVYVEFYIDTTGLTFNHRVLRGVRDDLDEEALNVVRLLLFDSPAKQRGKPVVVRYLVPVRFVLNKNNINWHLHRLPLRHRQLRRDPHPVERGRVLRRVRGDGLIFLQTFVFHLYYLITK